MFSAVYNSSHLAWSPGHLSPRAWSPGHPHLDSPRVQQQSRIELVSSCRCAFVCVCLSKCCRMTAGKISQTAVQMVLLRQYCCRSSCIRNWYSKLICRSGNFRVWFGCHIEPHRMQSRHHRSRRSSPEHLLCASAQSTVCWQRCNISIQSTGNGTTSAYSLLRRTFENIICTPGRTSFEMRTPHSRHPPSAESTWNLHKPQHPSTGHPYGVRVRVRVRVVWSASGATANPP